MPPASISSSPCDLGPFCDLCSCICNFFSLSVEIRLAHLFENILSSALNLFWYRPRSLVPFTPGVSPCSHLPAPWYLLLSPVDYLLPRTQMFCHLIATVTAVLSQHSLRSSVLFPTQCRSLPSGAPSPVPHQRLSALSSRLEPGPWPKPQIRPGHVTSESV